MVVIVVGTKSSLARPRRHELAALAQGKPIALGEAGTAPTPAILKQLPAGK
jgi:hypothetical protein